MNFRTELRKTKLDGISRAGRPDIDKLKTQFAKIVLPTEEELLKLAVCGESKHQIYYTSDRCAEPWLLRECFTYVHGTELFDGLPYKFGANRSPNINNFWVYVEWNEEFIEWEEDP